MIHGHTNWLLKTSLPFKKTRSSIAAPSGSGLARPLVYSPHRCHPHATINKYIYLDNHSHEMWNVCHSNWKYHPHPVRGCVLRVAAAKYILGLCGKISSFCLPSRAGWYRDRGQPGYRREPADDADGEGLLPDSLCVHLRHQQRQRRRLATG